MRMTEVLNVKLDHVAMNGKIAVEILKWEYDSPYDFYNNKLTQETLAEMMDGSYFAITNDLSELIGFFCTGKSAQIPSGKKFKVYEEPLVDMGLGMNPQLVGRGNGYEFCSYIVKFIEEYYHSHSIRLTVAKFNQRAIYLYKKLGFIQVNEFSTNFTDFITMVKKPSFYKGLSDT